MPVASGILTNGLGAGASAMILGQFNLGFLGVIVEEIPPSIPVSGGLGGDYEPVIQTQKYRIVFTIRRNNVKWKKSYVVDRKQGLILIRITKIINTVSNKIKFSITNIRKTIGNIKVKIWKR